MDPLISIKNTIARRLVSLFTYRSVESAYLVFDCCLYSLTNEGVGNVVNSGKDVLCTLLCRFIHRHIPGDSDFVSTSADTSEG